MYKCNNTIIGHEFHIKNQTQAFGVTKNYHFRKKFKRNFIKQ